MSLSRDTEGEELLQNVKQIKLTDFKMFKNHDCESLAAML